MVAGAAGVVGGSIHHGRCHTDVETRLKAIRAISWLAAALDFTVAGVCFWACLEELEHYSYLTEPTGCSDAFMMLYLATTVAATRFVTELWVIGWLRTALGRMAGIYPLYTVSVLV
eukprot:evm.model.scf_549EXC.3 EVM.evm.TU.scf_549EXC.3   scf_549EXC:69261-70348(-)